MNEYPRYVSRPAHQVLKDFSDESLSLDADMLRQKGERIAGTLYLFVSDRLPEPAYDAAALLPLARLVQQDGESEQKAAAAWALTDYLTNPQYADRVSPLVANYVMDALGDLPLIDEVVLDYQKQIRKKDTVFGHQVLRSITAENSGQIEPEFWTEARVGVNVPKIREVIHEVNVESVIIGAAEILDDIIHEEDESKQLHNLLIAESFYCPALEALGLSGMESALRGEVNAVRLTKADKGYLIYEANELLSPIKNIGQERVLETLFGVSLTNEKTRFHLRDETQYGTTIHFIDTNVHPTGFNKDVRVMSRIKDPRSIAMKRHENPDYENTLPSDIVGMTAIVKDVSELVHLFNEIAERVVLLENCRFVTAGSKKQPMFVKGGEDFKAYLNKNLDPAILEQIEFDPDSDDAFQVAKMTLLIEIDGVEIPVEVQFQTEEDRDNAETGKAPHFMQKTKRISKKMPGNIPGGPLDLVDIRDRKRIWLDLNRDVRAVGYNGPAFEERLYSSAK